MSTFTDDLVLIRKEMRISRQDVFYKCRIPIETIEAIEDGSIFSGQMRNKTYLRSYFRTYAKAIGIQDNDIIEALDKHEAGNYAGELKIKYLPDSEKDTETTSVEGDQAEGNKKEDKDEEQPHDNAQAGKSPSSDQSRDKDVAEHESDASDKSQKASKDKKTKSITPESQEKSVEDVEWEDHSIKKTLSTSTSGFSSAESRGPEIPKAEFPEPPDISSVDWASRVKQAVYRPQRNRLLWVLFAIVLALALAASSIYWFWQNADDPISIESPVENGIGAVTAEETESAEEPETAEQTPAPSEPAETEEAPAPATTAEEEQTVPDAPPEPDEPVISAEEETPADEDQVTIGEMDIPAEETNGEDPVVDDEEPLSAVDMATRVYSGTTDSDTLYVLAYALHGNLEPIRVQSDVLAAGDNQTASLQPYWVEHNQAMRFDFKDEIVFQGALSRMVLVFNGHIIDDFSDLYLDGPRIALNRDYLIENEVYMQPRQELFEEVPEPSSIVDRPRFTP